MWFLLGFLFGIAFTIGAIFLLAWLLNKYDRRAEFAKWIEKYENKAEAKFDKKVKPAEGSIGRFVLNSRGDIVRADDD